MSNCGLKWKFDFVIIKEKISNLPFVNKNKLNKLWLRIDDECCLPHDFAFNKWGWFKDYIKANYNFALNLIHLLYWTSVTWRLIVFWLAFFWTTLFWHSWFKFK